MAWDQEYMERRIIHSRPDSREDVGEVMAAIRFEMGRGALDRLDPEMVEDAIRSEIADRLPHR